VGLNAGGERKTAPQVRAGKRRVGGEREKEAWEKKIETKKVTG
jgi:glutaredoxin